MNTEITEKTREFLLACKKAGYERVTIFIHDKRVPCSVRLRKGSTGWGADEDRMVEFDGRNGPEKRFVCKNGAYSGTYWGMGNEGTTPRKVVCGFPERLRPAPTSVCPGRALPWMWQIVKDLDLNQRGAGHLDGHDIRPELCHLLTEGYYDLSEVN